MRGAAVVLSALALVCVADVARADVIDFDDLTPSSTGSLIADGYAGLDWDNFYALENGGSYASPSGYTNGIVSGDTVAFNGFGSGAAFSDGYFTLNSAYFTAAWNDGLEITVRGFDGATELFSVTFEVDTDGPLFVVFNWSGIDSVTFSSSGGTNAGLGGDGVHFAMDNLVINETVVPEPATLLLVGLGVGGAAWKRRRSRRCAA